MSHPSQLVIDIYRQHAQDYAAARSQTLFEKRWLDRFLVDVPKTGSVLDLGCGSGAPIATYIATTGRQVTGIDTAPDLLTMAQTRLPDHIWINADMRTLALPHRFDAVLAWNSFFHLTPDDQIQMFATFAKHAKPGAPLMFTTGPEAGERIGQMNGAPLYHASLAPEDYESLLSENGFSVIDFISEDPDCQGHTVWLARNRAD